MEKGLMRQIECALIFSALLLAAPMAEGRAQDAHSTVLPAGGRSYFTAKMENLTQKLQLNPDQQAKLKPIAEQEVGYLEEIQLNPVLSKKDKLKKLNAVLHNSDERMKPVLTSDQWEKLQLMRSEQKSELEKLARAPATTGEKP
jgi:hypothetical protein